MPFAFSFMAQKSDPNFKLMNEALFIKAVNERSKAVNMNPLLLLSGIEGLYTFKDIQLSAINYEFLDSLILTIFALRIGDQFHSIAEENLSSSNALTKQSAIIELSEMSSEDIDRSENKYLQSFAKILGGKSPVRKYHEKALEVAALEIKKSQLIFGSESIGIIILSICKDDPEDNLGLANLFRA
jgi:hypothetical protein